MPELPRVEPGSPSEVTADLVIIGAGPVGLYATYYAGFRGMRVVVIDSLPQPGGQMSAMYPEKKVYDVAGFPGVRAQTLVDALVVQAESAAPTYLFNEVATDFEEMGDGVRISTDCATVVRARAVLITAGIGKFTPRTLNSGTEYEGRGLRYFVPRLADLADQEVLIVGGGDSAVDWALSLEGVARKVTLVHRRDRFRAHEHSIDLLKRSTATVMTPYEVHSITGDREVDSIVVAHAETGEKTSVKASSVVAALGFKATLGPLAKWGLETYGRDIQVDRAMRTNHRRVFAAGDVCGHPEKVKLIAVGFGEAAVAVNHIAALIDDGASVTPGHSSDVVVP